MLTAQPAPAQVAPVSVQALADGCGVVLTAGAEREVLLAVTSLPLTVDLLPVPEPTPNPSIEPSASAEPAPPAEPSASPGLEQDPGAAPALPIPLLLGPEPRVVALAPAAGAGPDDGYRVLVSDPGTASPLLDLELALPLCTQVEPAPSPTGTPTATATPTSDPTAAPEPSDDAASPAGAGDGPTPGPEAPPVPDSSAVLAPGPPVTAPGSPAPTGVAARRSLPPRGFGRLSAVVRAWSRAGLPGMAVAPQLPRVAPDPAAVPAPVLAYPPGSTGVRLPAPADRPLAELLPSLPPAAARTPAPLITRGGSPPGLVDALPPALLAAVAGAGFLAAQLRRRVPLRHR